MINSEHNLYNLSTRDQVRKCRLKDLTTVIRAARVKGRSQMSDISDLVIPTLKAPPPPGILAATFLSSVNGGTSYPGIMPSPQSLSSQLLLNVPPQYLSNHCFSLWSQLCCSSSVLSFQ